MTAATKKIRLAIAVNDARGHYNLPDEFCPINSAARMSGCFAGVVDSKPTQLSV